MITPGKRQLFDNKRRLESVIGNEKKDDFIRSKEKLLIIRKQFPGFLKQFFPALSARK